MRLHKETILLRRGNGTTYTKAGVSVVVYETGTTTLATVYSDFAGTSAVSGSELTTDINGKVEFYVGDGIYDLYVSGTGVTSHTVSRINVTDLTAYSYDVTSYGAVGDGTTDDTVAIQAALTAGVGATVVFPPRTYSVSGTMMTFGSGTKISGYGATLKLAAGTYSADTYFLGTRTSLSYESGTAYTENVTIEGLKLDGNISNVTTTESCTGVNAHQVNDFTMRDCEIVDLPGEEGPGALYGIMVCYSNRARIENCHIDRTDKQNICIWETTGAVIDGCVLNYSYSRGCILVSSNSAPTLQQSRARIVNCEITNASTGSTGNNRGIRFSSGGSGVVDNCYITATDHGVYIVDVYEKDVKICNTEIRDCSYGVQVASDVDKKVTVSDCSIVDCGEGVYVSAVGGWVIVRGTTIEGSTTGALTVDYADHIVVTGNILDGGDFVSVRPTNTAAINSNVITNMTGASYSLLVSNGSGGTADVVGNQIYGNTADKPYILTDGQVSLSGTGVPSITAPLGAQFHRTDGTGAQALYVNESTGWVAK